MLLACKDKLHEKIGHHLQLSLRKPVMPVTNVAYTYMPNVQHSSDCNRAESIPCFIWYPTIPALCSILDTAIMILFGLSDTYIYIFFFCDDDIWKRHSQTTAACLRHSRVVWGSSFSWWPPGWRLQSSVRAVGRCLAATRGSCRRWTPRRWPLGSPAIVIPSLPGGWFCLKCRRNSPPRYG